MTLDRYAVASGAWENPSTWDGGLSVPGSTDNVWLNGENVTLNASTTVKHIYSVVGGPASGDGMWLDIQPGAIPVVLTITDGQIGSDIPGTISAFMEILAGTGNVTINSSLISNSIERALDIYSGYTGMVTINGDVHSGAAAAEAIRISSTAVVTLNVNGSVYGAGGPGILDQSTGATINVSGTVYGGDSAHGIQANCLHSRITVQGKAIGGSGDFKDGIYVSQGGAGADPQVTVLGGIEGGTGRESYGVNVNTNNATPGGSVRFNGELRWGKSAPIYVYSLRGGPMVVGDGSGASISFIGDSGWPAVTGIEIVIGGSGGPPGPDDLGYLTVQAKGIVAFADSNDSGAVPDTSAVVGTVTLTPSLSKPVRIISSGKLLAVASVTADFDSSGILSYDGQHDVRILAPQWTDLSNNAWTWIANVKPGPGQTWQAFDVTFTGAPGATINLAAGL